MQKRKNNLEFIITKDGFRPDFTKERRPEFFPDQYRGMYEAVLSGSIKDSSPSLDFLKRITENFFFQLERTPSLSLGRENVVVSYDMIELEEILSNAPFILGSQNLNSDWVLTLFDRYLSLFKSEISTYTSSVEAYFSSFSTRFKLPSRIFFHLLESKKPEAPFAFMATYSTVGEDGKVHHYPLKYALKEYSSSIEKLAILISSIKKAAKSSRIISSWLNSGEIFSPIYVSKEEAYAFLMDVPLFEEAGIVTRIPGWWKKRKRSSSISIESDKKGSKCSISSFRPKMVWQGVEITEEEIRDILSRTEGLYLLKGSWIEVDKNGLEKLLKEYEELEERELSLLSALKMASGVEERAYPVHIDIDDMIKTSMASDIPSSPPSSFTGTLRPYQIDGFRWLQGISRLSLGPLLADDMGLGKTVEILAYLEEFREKNRDAKVLLIVPASLLGNWGRECIKFTPDLDFTIRHGKEAKKKDFPFLTIVTYQGASTSAAIQEEKWDIVILDEAQNIKNRNTKQTKVIKALDRKQSIAMTGTPIENSLMNLWSIFDFLSPGLLGDEKSFASFTASMAEDKMDNLKRVITPFILRRLKSDKTIIDDLPDKVENTLMVSLTPEQRVLYNKVVDEYEEALEKMEESGANALAITGATIMKLKMVANHPSQYLGNGEYEDKKSGKFLLLKELCTTIHENREKVLVFTQFASIIPELLKLLSTVFEEDGEYIDGSTPPKKRTEIVESFQSGELPFLVISLKAGGTGLTLTEANNVIHFDRWWNPAVEDQATDRAYRIGQKNIVTVYKFVAEDTIEERISQILKEKAELAESMIGDIGGEVTSKLSPRELLSAMRYQRKL
ncbi:DEAD/DEAH box helicase [Bullifex porci]|uniref:DEAD/DEAH box helicase n=1 Tax=Bullifex porci TaxID=2606638 RepID=UPI0023F123D6|nr:DEAD/DEAH box helicase [Bullifex porci]MDD7588085.1 SNF2-related protein [Bullifex porci]